MNALLRLQSLQAGLSPDRSGSQSATSPQRCLKSIRRNDQRASSDCNRAHRQASFAVRSSALEEDELVDQDFLEELNRVSNSTLEVLSSCEEDKAHRLSLELQELQQMLEGMNDKSSVRFLNVLLGFLDHKVPKEIDSLSGMYSRAADRILNQVAGSAWELQEEGKPSGSQEPTFSTWDDVINKKRGGSYKSHIVKDETYYRLLQVNTAATAAEIKSAYRSLALKLHPDVNHEADASERFAEVSNAYDVLSNPEARQLYDAHGLEAERHPGLDAGKGNARVAWDEFKPFRKENKRTRARDAVQSQSSPVSGGDSMHASEDSSVDSSAFREPQIGDVVEYPLREIETEDFKDGRSHGVGLLVGRNMDRGDAAKLPPDQLDLCEIESLRQEEPESDRWIADDLGIPSFAKLGDLKVVPVESFNKRFSVWTIHSKLSEGCGGPPLPEEIIL